MDLIFIFGGAASGKLTTARALADRVGYPVFHNHLVVDLLTTVFPFGTEPFVRLREEFWLSVITDAARTGRSLIFTFAPESTVAAGFDARLRAAVEGNGGRLCSIQLDVGVAEQEARLGNPSRTEFHKLTDVELLRAGRGAPVDWPSADLVIDTEHSAAEESAAAIIDRFDLARQAELDRYPN